MSDDAAKLVAALRRPGMYPGAVDRVDYIETHISWVFLAGEFAYKVKRPVDYGFVDFTTLQRRKHCCEEELRLNRRLAPEIYLDVVAIRGTQESPRWDFGDGSQPSDERDPIIEYAVRMRRFEQDQLLSRAIKTGRLTAEHVDALAAEVADFHAAIPAAGLDSPFGSFESVVSPVRENFDLIARGTFDAALPAKIARLSDWSEQRQETLRAEFARRRAAGCVRECHGDMHLGNMILDGDRVTIFDCIEFNDSLRWIDVLSETAFLVMDLEDRGRADFARRCLNAYLEQTGDYTGLPVLPYYLVYRALVRAKVASLRLEDAKLSPRERDAQMKLVQGYVELADRYTRAPAARLIITHGLSGSGKTFGTGPIVEQLGAVRVRSDVERKRLAGLEPTESSRSEPGEGIYVEDATRRTYARLAECAAAGLRAGYQVIVDATFLRRADRDTFRQLAKSLNDPFAILDFQAPIPVLRERISRRLESGRDASEADLAVLDGQIADREPLGDDERQHVLPIDTTAVDWREHLLDGLGR